MNSTSSLLGADTVAYASSSDTSVHIHPQSSQSSLHRFSQIRRKPPPSFRYSAADPQAQIWEIKGRFPGGQVVLHPPTPSDEVDEFWNSVANSDSETEEKSCPTRAVRTRPRAHTVPAKRYTNLIRVPPPVVDLDLLTTARSSGALRSASLPDQTIHDADLSDIGASNSADSVASIAPQPQPEDEPESEDDTPAPSSQRPKPRKSRSFRKSAVSFMQKRTGSFARLSVASISAPVIQPSSGRGRKYSVVSMASTNTSMISLSAFPRPPEAAPPPVPALPSLHAFNPPRPEMRSLHSYILHVDPPQLFSEVARVQRPEKPIAHSTELSENEVEVAPSKPKDSPARIVTFAGAKAKPPVGLASERRIPPEPHFDFGEPPDYDGFDQDRLPTWSQLETAAALPVISEGGVRVPFGSLWRDQKTIVCFIRHFWCPLCQDYMFSISRNVSAEVLHKAGVELVIISNGSYEMIKSYRRIFRTPFALYTDPTHKVYNALGMTLQTLEKGPRGSYIQHGMMSGIGMVVLNAVKVGMPVWKQGGEISQLGGEFILGPGMTCSWVHRMKYTRNHVPILQVIEAAGVDMYSPLQRAASSTGGSFLGMSSEEESKWMERRRKVLKKLKAKKMSRRGGTQWMDTVSTTTTKRSSGSSVGSETAEISKRNSVGTEAAASACSWDPSVEQAINVGAVGFEDDAIIEEAEEEDGVDAEDAEARTKPEQEPHKEAEKDEVEAEAGTKPEQKPRIDEEHSETQSQSAPSEVLSDIKSEYGDSFVAEEDESSATDVDSEANGDSAVEVSFDVLGRKIGADARTLSDRSSFSSLSSFSSVGSGYQIVVEHHAVFFESSSEKVEGPFELAIVDSSLGS